MPRPSHRQPAGYPEWPAPEPPPTSGRWIGWTMYAVLALVGFCFGAWAGNQRPTKATTDKTTEVARAPSPSKEPKEATPPPDRPESKPSEKPAPEMAPKKNQDSLAATTPKTRPPETVTPEPKSPAPKPPEPKKPEPKKPEPKPEAKSPEPKPAAVKEVSFAKEIVPIFRSKCLNCHGAVGNPKGGLDLRTVATIIKGGDSGDGVKPGDLKNSPVWASIEEGTMPPNGKDPLTAAEKKLVENWILSGAKP